MTKIQKFSDADSLANGAAQLFVKLSRLAIESTGRFNVALAGGSTPQAMYALLATDYVAQVAWDKVYCFWGDDRTVPPDHPDSNYRMAYDTLLKHVPIPPENVHRILSENPPQVAAESYIQTLHSVFGDVDYPRFDLVLLGMGDDGHTASLFPHTQGLSASGWVTANCVPQLDTWRITLTAPLINHAACVAFLVSGSKKSVVLREVLNGPYLPDTYPAQRVEPINGDMLWYVDEAAAELI